MSKFEKVPSAREMRRFGFTDRREGHWYWSTRVGSDTTFNLTIEKETGEYETVVLNESFGQPEYYGRMVAVYGAQIVANVDVALHELRRFGLDIEFSHAEYGVQE
ncbi:MAG: hypothetical protein D3X82_13915 [Candidatus Leucobacter sulfamidivorax]|nr:hypothetical protein [Candidatus Leucobacter sulfamidivorax]